MKTGIRKKHIDISSYTKKEHYNSVTFRDIG